jgi:hypothetical protein
MPDGILQHTAAVAGPAIPVEIAKAIGEVMAQVKSLGGFKFGRKHRSHALIEVVDGKDVQTIVRGGAGAN